MTRPIRWILPAAALLLLAACVTINVYFPAAQAEQAAREFVNDVIGNGQGDADPPPRGNPGAGLHLRTLFLPVSSAHAQADINVRTPAITTIRERMRQRFETLRPHFEAGVLGMTRDGRIAVRDASSLALRDRNAVNQAVADDNRDRDAVYREIALANGQPGWEDEIRATFARQWIDQARPGWYYQDASGAWTRK
ncbi:MAG: YdbL family protein [Xanthomonadales bacterium]|nr:YdbL family protein [Xanthomonadales bacterium]